MRRLYNADANDATPDRPDLNNVGDLLNMMFPAANGMSMSSAQKYSNKQKKNTIFVGLTIF
jgi:hypothetical protein